MPEMRVTRRGFLGEALAAFGFAAAGGRTLFAAPKGWKPPKGAKLVFGALSDTHLRTDYTGLKAARTFPHKYLISALEYFRSQNVDAVVHCGDAAHRGQIRELEFHAEAWNKVFPKGLAPDGHRIEKLFVTGNHEIDGWQYGNDVGFKVERVFKDPEERARRILVTDIASSWERVWGETYEPVWHKEVKGYHFFGRHYGVAEGQIAQLVKEVEAKQGFRKIGVARQGYVFRLYDDMMAIERREFGEGGSLGTDWIMPLDACKIENGKVKPHPFSREELKKAIGEPQFREGAKLVVEGGKVKIPLADGNPKCRVYAYEVAVDGELRKAVYAAGGNMGIGHETNGGVTEVEIPNQDLPAGAAAAIAVTPLSSLGTRGRPITINSFRG